MRRIFEFDNIISVQGIKYSETSAFNRQVSETFEGVYFSTCLTQQKYKTYLRTNVKTRNKYIVVWSCQISFHLQQKRNFSQCKLFILRL